MPELGKAYVQIIPSAEGISGKISSAIGGEATSAGTSAGKSMGGSLVGALKGVILAAGIGSVVKEALSAGGDLQQSFGGLDTIYGDAAKAAKDYAYQAQSAGISANDYAEQAVSFGASLKQAFEGNTTKAMEAANTAILDMTDNAAKMGTPIESIQNAYQGFAKQNYTMLDNLKLGYGGTKSEMERLLTDATKLSGVEYDISNLGDVYDAIHVIQGDLGLTGVAAEEVSSTFTGSFGAMKAASQNLLANLTTGADITGPLNALLTSAQNFILNNLAPMLGNIMAQLPTLLNAAFSTVIGAINLVSSNADTFIQQGLEIITSLITGLISNVPLLVDAAFKLVKALGSALVGADWLGIAGKIMTALLSAFGLDTSILQSGVTIVKNILKGITTTLPSVLDAGVNIISNIANGILKNLSQITKTAIDIVTSLAKFILQNLPTILNVGAQLILSLVKGVVNNLPQLVQAITSGLAQFVAAIRSSLPEILAQGVEIIVKLAAGIIQAIPKIIAILPQVINAIKNGFTSVNWAELGTKLLDGVKNGIKNAVSKVTSAISDTAKAIQNKFKGVNWSSLGSDLLEKIKSGIKNAISKVQSAISDVTTAIKDKFKNFDFKAIGTDILDRIKSGIENAIDKVKTKIGDVTKAIKGVFDNFNFKDIGKNMLDGIGEGITGAASNLISTLWGAVEGAIKWVKKKLGIESPSRLMADTVGKYMALGLGQGFEDNMPEVDMADAVLNTTAAMAQATQSGIDTNTTEINYQLLYEAVKAGASAANVELYFNNREVARSLRDIGVTVG